jgi:hypothetical protein
MTVCHEIAWMHVPVKREAQDGKSVYHIFVCEIRFGWLTVLSIVKGRNMLHERRLELAAEALLNNAG